MFKLASNKEIGEYLRKLTREHGHKNDTDFDKAYLDEKYGRGNWNEDNLKTTKNTFSQIFNGQKGITTEQLMIVSKLLCVSCEEILSAGKHYVPTKNHITNYEIAQSKNKKVWDEYMKREDRLFLNCDEYRKSVIDYALEFENYDFIKYLLDEGFIWFVSESHYDNDISYGAGTKIKSNWDRFSPLPDGFTTQELFEKDKLRTQTAVLAIKHGDCDILDSLRARETPDIHNVNTFILGSVNFNLTQNRNDDLIEAIALTENEKIIDYFSEEFIIKNRDVNENTYIFPYLSDVIEKMIENKNYKSAEVIIRKAIEHNKNTYNKISDIIDKCYKYFIDLYGREDVVSNIDIKNYIEYRDNWVSVLVLIMRSPMSLKTNIIKVKSKCSSLESLIKELNEWHNKIISLGGEENG